MKKTPSIKDAMNAYGLNSKERFPSYDSETQNKRVGTTFYADFMFGEVYGERGLKETWKCVWDEWKNNCNYLIELAVCLNHRCWEL